MDDNPEDMLANMKSAVLEEADSEAFLLNTLMAMPQGAPRRIIDLCYNSLHESSMLSCIEALNALAPEVQHELEMFMTDDGKASYKAQYNYICRYFPVLSTEELTQWVFVARAHVNAVADDLGCNSDDVIKSISPLLSYRLTSANLMSTVEQERAVLGFLSLCTSMNQKMFGNGRGIEFLNDPVILKLVCDFPDKVADIFELCVQHGNSRGFVVREIIERTTAPAIAGGLL